MEEITKQTILPEVEYRVIHKGGIGNFCYIPQYRNKVGLFRNWKDCTEQKYDGRDGDWYTSRFTFNNLEDATAFIEKEIEKNTVTIYNKKSWFR